MPYIHWFDAGFGRAEIVNDEEAAMLQRIHPQPVITEPPLDEGDTQPSDVTQPLDRVDYVGLERAARIIREQKAREEVWLSLPTPSLLMRFIQWYWRFVDRR